MEDQAKALATARIWQPLVCLSLLAGIGLSALAGGGAIHNEAFGIWMDRKLVEVNDTANEYRRQYLDTEDRVVLEEVGRTGRFPRRRLLLRRFEHEMGDASRPAAPPNGGSSITSGAANRRPFYPAVHRVPGEPQGILQAGPEKTLIVYGRVSSTSSRPATAGQPCSRTCGAAGALPVRFRNGHRTASYGRLVRDYTWSERAAMRAWPTAAWNVRALAGAQGAATAETPKIRRSTPPTTSDAWDPLAEDLAAHRQDLQQLADYLRR